MANVTEQTRTAQINSFTGGINTDLHPLLQPNDTLTDCVNGTLITYNGNENMLQNDMGNYQLRNAKLPEGYIPMGMKEHQGILYLALYNPITKKVQLGSYPSPQTDFSKNGEAEEFELHPIEIGVLVDPEGDRTYVREYSDTDALPLKEKVWKLIESSASNFLYSQLDKSQSTIVFTKDYSDESTFAVGDKYLISHEVSSDESEEAPFQKLKYFVINEDKKTYDVDESDLEFVDTFKEIDDAENDPDDYKTVAWEQQGWLGAKYEINNVGKIEQDVNVSLSRYIAKDYSKYSKTIDEDQYTHNFALHKLDTDYPNLKDFIESCDENQMIILDGTPDFKFTDGVEVIDGFTHNFGNGDIYFKGLSILDDTPEYQTLIDGSFVEKIIVLDKITSDSQLPTAVKGTGLADWGLWVKGECNLSKIKELNPKYLFLGPNSSILGNLDSNFSVTAYVPESVDTSNSGDNVQNYTASEAIEKVFVSNLPAIYYGLSKDAQDIKIGLTGTWNIESNVYTCKDTDSIAAIEGFLSSVQKNDLAILLPKNKAVKNLYPNRYVVRSGYKENFDFIIEDSEVVIYCDDDKIKPQEEVQNVVIYPTWKLQFGNVQIAQESMSSTISNALKISNVEISRSEDGKEDILSVSVQKGFDTQLELFKKKYTDKTDECTSVPINSGSIYYLSADTNPVTVNTGLQVINHYSKTTKYGKTFGIITYIREPIEITACSVNVEEIIIPGSVNLIKTGAFNGCYNLKHIQIFDENYYYSADFKIETNAFYGCTNLKKLVINRCLTLESEAFNNSGISQLICHKLYLKDDALIGGTSLKIWTTNLELEMNPEDCMSNVTVCLNKPYWKYSNLDYYLEYVRKYPNTSVEVAKIIPPEGRYLEYTIDWNSVSSLLDASAVKVGKCFQNYKHGDRWWITYNEIPEQLPNQMFKDVAITSVSIPEGIKKIPLNCFDGCSLLKKLVLPDSVENIGSNALPDGLSEVTFGRNFTGDVSLHISGDSNNSSVIVRFKCSKVPTNISLSGNTSREIIFITPENSNKWSTLLNRLNSWNKTIIMGDASARAYKTITLDASVTLWGNHNGFEKSSYKADNNIYITDPNITNMPETLFANVEGGNINIGIPSGIKSICKGELNQLALLPYKDVTINLPEGIEYLGHNALEFNNTDTTRSIKKINFPASITRVEDDMLARFPDSMEIYTDVNLFSKEFSESVSSEVTIPYEYAHISRIYSTKFSSTCSEDPYELVRLVSGFVNVGGTHVVVETEDVVFNPGSKEPWFENVVLNYKWNSSETLQDYTGLNYIVPEQFYGYSTVNNDINGVYIGEDSVKYSFLFDKTKLSEKFLFWKSDSKAGNFRKIEKTLDYEYNPSQHSTYVVPNPEDVRIDARNPFRSNYALKSVFGGEGAENYFLEFNINVSGQTSKVSTKIDIDGEYQLYEDLSSGTYRNLIRRSQFPNTITVSSVPYNYIESSGHCLIYDNLKTSEVLNLNRTDVSQVSKFQYKCTDSTITLMLETTDTNDLATVDRYIDLYKINSGRLSKIECDKRVINRTTENVEEFSNEIDMAFTLNEGDSVNTNSFGFVHIELSGATTYLPIYFGMTETLYDNLCAENHIDFSKSYFDELGITNSNQNATYSCETTHPYIFKDYNKNIVFQSKRPFLWHSVKDHFGTTDGTNYGYYGCARKEDVSINLSKFKLVDGNRYSIKLGNTYLERNKEFYSNDTALQNAEGDIVWTGQVINGQNVTKYKRSFYENDPNPEFCDTICKRDYMLKYAGCPMTVNVEKEYGWTKEMADYAGWTDVGNINSLFISKSAGKNPYVRIGVDSINNLENSDDGHSKAIECTSSTQVLNKVTQAHSDMDGGTTQFATPVICKLTTKKNGFILPIPKDLTKFSYYYEKTLNNKKNRGTDSAVVLTRQTKALQIDQAIFQAFMSLVSAGVVVGGVMGGIAIALALGFAAGVSAIGMAIPIVGWAVAVAAALTACVYAIINYCKGVDQKFDFYALKGTGNNLIMPIWGKVNVKNRGVHPFYTNVDPSMIEKMLLFLYTRVYRISRVEEVGGHLVKTDETEVVDPQPLTLELYGRSLETRFDFIQECINLAKLLNINTNNFTEKNPEEFEQIMLSTANTTGVENRFENIIHNQQLVNKEDAEHVGEFSFESCGNYDIDSNVSRFVSNLTLNDVDNSDSWAYDINKGTINTYAQECFGGNRGGCNVDLKVFGWGKSWEKRLMSGEFPHKKDGFIPVAYPAKVGEDPILSTCPTDIYAEYIYKIDRENNRDDEYLTWIVNTKSNEI